MRLPTLLVAALVCSAAHGASSEMQPYRGDSRSPALSLPALNGGNVSLEDYRGQVVLVNFWASWCTPCLVEMPSLQRLEEVLSGQPFAVVTVNIGENPATVRRWLEELEVSLTVLMDADSRATRAWRVFAFPSTFIVDRDGLITHANFGALEWDDGPTFELIQSLVSPAP